MRKIFRKWIDRYFSDEEALFLFLLLSGALLVIWVLGQPLAPVIASIILAFLMQGVVDWLQRRGIGHLFAVISVFLLFIGFVSAFLLFVLPIVIWQGERVSRNAILGVLVALIGVGILFSVSSYLRKKGQAPEPSSPFIWRLGAINFSNLFRN